MGLIRIENERQILEFGVDDISRQIWGGDVSRQFPIYLVFHKGHLCGFFQLLQQACVYPALHPEFMSPREFIKVTRSLVTEGKRAFGDILFLLCPKATQIGEKGMRLIRLKKATETAFIYDEDAP
jgi:hypothetical protein